jgi:hypothetical protein
MGHNEVEGGEAAAPASGPGTTDGRDGRAGRTTLSFQPVPVLLFSTIGVWKIDAARATYLTS